MEKEDVPHLTEFPRFESEPTQSGVTTFFNRLLKFPIFSPGESSENSQAQTPVEDKVSEPEPKEELVKEEDEESKVESGAYAVEMEARSLQNVLRRISSLVALGSGGGTRYADTELARYWMPDDISRECYECGARFSALRRRHHCRVCGQIFCSHCCNQRVPGQIFGCAGGLRVCNYCCNIVLSYLRENDFSDDMSPDLKTLQESLQLKYPDITTKPSHQSKDFMFAREQDERVELRISPKETVQEVFRMLYNNLPAQQHRYRLVRYQGVWRGCDIMQWISENTSHKAREQVLSVCQSLVKEGYIVSMTEQVNKFADYALYKPVMMEEPKSVEDRAVESSGRLVGSLSSYCLDLNVNENSARIIKTPKQESKLSPSSDEAGPLIQNNEIPNENKNVCSAIAESGEDHLKLLLRQCLARDGLSASWLEVVYPLCQQASHIVLPDIHSNNIDIRKYVQIKKVTGGEASQSVVVPGISVGQHLVQRGMPTVLTKPDILLLQCSVAYPREGRITTLEPMILQEREYLVRCAARITALKAQLVLVRGSAAQPVQDALRENGIALATGVREKALDRAARCTLGDVLTSIDARIGTPKLGTCNTFYVKSFPDTKKTLMILEGCARQNLGCCIILRGGSHAELVRVKKIIKFMLLACYNWRLEHAFLIDIEASLPEPGATFDDTENDTKVNDTKMISDTKMIIDTKMINDNDEKSEAKVNEDPLQFKNYRKTDSDKTSSGVPIKDFSDPLRAHNISTEDEVFLPKEEKLKADKQNSRWSMDDAVLSMSPNVVITAPYLETEAGRKCHLRKYFHDPLFHPSRQKSAMTPKTRRKISQRSDGSAPVYMDMHPFIRNPLTNLDERSLKTLLADYRATGCRLSADSHYIGCPLYSPCLIKKAPVKQPEVEAAEESQPPDPLDPQQHQQLSLLLYSFSAKSANYPDFCSNPWVVNMEMYGNNDITLGAFLDKYCFNSDYKCPSTNCVIPVNQHVRKFVHDDGCITITCNTIGHSAADKTLEDQNNQVMFWWRCSLCGAACRARPLSFGALRLSLAKQLELRLKAARYLLARGPCLHPRHAVAHHYARRLTTACFKYSKLKLWDIGLPPDVIATTYDTKAMRDTLLQQVNELMLKGHETFKSLSDNDVEKDYLYFKQHMEQIHLALTSSMLQEQTTFSGVVRSLWNVSDRVIAAEKLLRDASDNCTNAPAQLRTTLDSTVEERCIEDSSDSTSDNAEVTLKTESDHQGLDEEEDKADKKTVKQLLSQLLSNNQPSNQLGMIISGGLFPVVVFAGEIGSVIAATLASVQYQRQLKVLLAQAHSNHLEQEDGENLTMPTKEKADGDRSKNSKCNDHIEVLLKDGLLCRVYFAAQFCKLRSLLLAPLSNNINISDQFADTTKELNDVDTDDKGEGVCEVEEGFIRSLSHCVAWAARGGKSGSNFCKTTDDRYVLKEMTKPEWQQFLDFAPHYFNYVTSSHQNQLPTLLARIVGVYGLGGGGVLVMENLLYGRTSLSGVFDLKGSVRHRLASGPPLPLLPLTPSAAPPVLLDENLLLLRWEGNGNGVLHLSCTGGCVVSFAIKRDTEFLANRCVMDYSLLLGLDGDMNQGGTLVLGIIDYIRTFTWDKKLEHLVKKNLGSGQPTVVSPELYKMRFRAAIDKYLPRCPSHWDRLHRGLRC